MNVTGCIYWVCWYDVDGAPMCAKGAKVTGPETIEFRPRWVRRLSSRRPSPMDDRPRRLLSRLLSSFFFQLATMPGAPSNTDGAGMLIPPQTAA